MSLTRLTMQALVDEVREDLDEPYAAPPDTTNFWSQDYIVRQINRGLRQVWQICRNDKGSEWFVRKLRSNDPVLTIFGQVYNPAGFRGTDGKTELILPPDLGELLFLEPILNTNTDQAADVRFRYEPGLNGPAIRELSRTTASVGLAEYWGAVVQRHEGPRFVFKPPFADTTVDFEMEYVVKPDSYALADTFEGLGFDDLLLDAVEAYAVQECLKKAADAAALAKAKDTWAERKALVIEAAAPLQTVEYETVNGFLPDDGGW
jgi:hypothetical protein